MRLNMMRDISGIKYPTLSGLVERFCLNFTGLHPVLMIQPFQGFSSLACVILQSFQALKSQPFKFFLLLLNLNFTRLFFVL